MSDINDLIHTNARVAFDQGVKTEQQRILSVLNSYFELTQELNEDGTQNDNPEWDNGFQAAMALIKGEQK